MRSLAALLLLFLLPAPLLPAAGALIPVDEDGYRNVLAGQRHKVVLVDFWATWCEPCREEMPALVALAKKYRGRGVVLVTVSADEPEQEAAAGEFLARTGAPAPAYIKRANSDEDFINSVDRAWSGALPSLFLYDRQGRKAASFTGETEIAQIETALRKLL
jgi:thiol-disulfide isomerase/thioredoxin